MISQINSLESASLGCKCVFYRPEHNGKGDPKELNFEGPEMEKWNTSNIERIYQMG